MALLVHVNYSSLDTYQGTTHAGLIPEESPLYPFFDRHLFSYSTDEWRQFKSLLNIKYWSLSDELLGFLQQQASTYCVAVDDAIEAHEGLVQVKDLSLSYKLLMVS